MSDMPSTTAWANHTPTPWRVDDSDGELWIGNDNLIRPICMVSAADVLSSTDKADAAFIVEAVNNYDRLRAELDAANNNHRSMAMQLADIGRELERAKEWESCWEAANKTIDSKNGELAAALAKLERARKALEGCQKVLAMIIDPKAVKTTSVTNAFAQATEAECKARTALTEIGN